jgi:hypothetical protein
MTARGYPQDQGSPEIVALRGGERGPFFFLREVSMITTDDMVNETRAEVVQELFADGTFRTVPCRACGAVTFFSDPAEEFCVACQVEHDMMRVITLAPDRYCPHCDMIRSSEGMEPYGLWREHPSCLACGEAGYFPELGPDLERFSS